MLKYDSINYDEVIDQPSILTVTKDQVTIIHASGTDEMEIPDEGQLAIQIGNIDSFDPPTPTPEPEPEPTPTPTPAPTGDASITVTIKNNASGTLNIKNLSFVMWNEGQTDNALGEVVTNNKIQSGETKTCTVIFEDTFSREISSYFGLHFATSEQCATRNFLSNCGFTTESNGYFFTTSGLDSNDTFEDEGSYSLTIPADTTEWSGGGQTPEYDTDPDPEPTPTPSGDHSVISFGLNITNAYGSAIQLVGEVVFIIGNPDKDGNYMGSYTGRYVRTDHITFNNGTITLQNNQTASFNNVSWRDTDTGLGMGGTSPFDPALLSDIDRKSNVLLYVYEQDGTKNSEIVLCDSLSKDIVFENGQTYNITFRQPTA